MNKNNYSIGSILIFITVLVIYCVITHYHNITVTENLETNIIEVDRYTREFKRKYNKEISSLHIDKNELKDRIDILESHLELLEGAVDVDAKHQAAINRTVTAIKSTLPEDDNPLKGCRSKPSQGETRRIADSVTTFSKKYSVSPSLILAIIKQESLFCNSAVSRRGARGYMQIMPETAVEITADTGLSLKVWKERDNIHLGTVYIGTLLLMFKGDIDLAIRAYNSGPSHVKRVLDNRTQEQTCKDGRITKYYCETDRYAELVQKYKEEYQKIGLK